MSQVSTSVNSPQALDGVRVLDITGPAGFYCTKLMADLGADVVRIDPPDSEESGPGPFFVGDSEQGSEPDRNRSLYRWHYHTNKRSVLLDIESSSGRRVFDSLLSAADVLVDTYRPSEALGLGGARLRRDYPSLVHTTITGFGPDGPYVDYKATDIVALAMGGLMAITGYPEAPPNQLGGEQAYQMASMHAAVGTLLALLSRDLDGTGRDVQVALQDCVSMATLQTANFNFYTWFGTVRSRSGLNNGTSKVQPHVAGRWMPHTLYACKDGWIAYATIGAPPDNWEHFVTWLSSYGAEQELGDPRFEDPDVQMAEQDRINDVTAEFAAQHTSQELYHSAQRLSILCTPVQTVADLVKDEQLLDRGYFVEVEHPEMGRTFTYPGAPYVLSETPWRLKSRAPLIGEHTLDVLNDWLELSAEESAELLDREAPQDD